MEFHPNPIGLLTPPLLLAILLGFWLIRSWIQGRERARLYDLVERAGDAGRALPPEVLARLGPQKLRGPRSDLRSGLILVAIALGLAVAGLINFATYPGPHPQLFFGPYGLFPIPGMIGVAFLVMAYVRRDDRP